MFNIGDKLTKENYTAGAIWATANKAEVKLIDGEYVIVAMPEPLPPTKEEIQALRSEAYKAEVDPIMSEYTRKKTFNLFKEGEEELLLEKIYLKANEVKEYFPYPEENI